MKRTIAALAASAAMIGTTVGVAGAAGASPAHGSTSMTTLDACGYFYGEQTPAFTHADGGTTTQKGTWTGVWNNYVDTRVASLGTVQGAFSETTSTYGTNGQDTQGTESFTSNAGKIDQTFSYGPDVVGGFNVDVTATRDLSFLTSNTNGACYSGPFPRP
jgi:hypothetical protein